MTYATTTEPLGTTKTLFGREYVYIDPQLINGIGLWRDTNLPPAPIDITVIGAIAPIISTQYNQGREVNLSFDIEILEDVVTSSNKALITADKLINDKNVFMPRAPQITSLKTIKPVFKIEQGTQTVLFFDISALDYFDLTSVHSKLYQRRMRTKTNSYNSSRSAGPSLTATAPMVEDTEGSSATVSFDITDLNYV